MKCRLFQCFSGLPSTVFALLLLMPEIAGQESCKQPGSNSAAHCDDEKEYPPYDGWFNNFAHPDWGAAGQQLVEEILDAQGSGCPPEYFNIPIPKGDPLFDPKGEGGREIPLLRTRYDARTGHSPNAPREQLNEVTPYFDGNLMYGPGKAWADSLRLFKDGLLAATNDSTDPAAIDRDRYFPALNDVRLPFANPPPPRDHVLKPVKRFYKIGNPRGNENPFLLTFGILWFRYHNFRARQLKANHPDWSDEKLFNEARKWVIAVHQNIVYYQWLPEWLGEPLEPYQGYDPHIHPQISHVFQSAAMRFGHTLVPPGVFRRVMNRTLADPCVFLKTTTATKFDEQQALRTCNVYWNGQEAIRESDIDPILMGMASQIAEREDHIVTPDLHGHVFGPLEFSRRDLMAVNIQRGRDHGLPDYNTAREFFNLSRVERFEDINPALNNRSLTPDSLLQAISKTKVVYNDSMADVDIWPAGMLETTYDGPGPLFRAIIKNQFRRIRAADRFWFENYKMNKLFTKEEVAEIRTITLTKIILDVTQIKAGDIQANPFIFSRGRDPCPQPFQLNPKETFGHVENCTRVESFNYFTGSEATYILTIFGVLSTSLVFGVLLVLMAGHHEKSTQSARNKLNVTRLASQKVNDPNSTVPVVEWIGDNQGTRAVLLNLNVSKKHIEILEEQKPVRLIDLSRLTKEHIVRIILSADTDMRMMLISVPKDYDLVLNFQSGYERQLFLDNFKNFVSTVGVRQLPPMSMSEKMIKKAAITKAVRQRRLEKFFSAVVSHALKYDVERIESLYDSSEASAYINCELTRSEFAEGLGLKADSLFVTNMFNLVDTSNNGYISFREFLNFFVIFTKGTAEDKAKLMFDMYDLERSGELSTEDFKTMIKSMVELANEKIEEKNIDSLVSSLFERAGLDKKNKLTFNDFKRTMDGYNRELGLISLDMQYAKEELKNAKRENGSMRAKRTLTYLSKQGPSHRSYTLYGEVKTIEKASPKTKSDVWWQAFEHFFENYKRQIFWVTLYTVVLWGIFLERVYVFAVEREVSGLRRICGYGVAVTRGAANVMMFAYSSLLVTMCRNLITYLRDTVLHRYIPFDEAVTMHKYIAYWATFFTLTHIIGHCFNIYHISTQTPNDLACLFRNYFHPTDEIPNFARWCWRTVTGLTGLGLTAQMFLIFCFALPYARRHTFRAFWITHMTYPVFFIQMILHGSGRMIQAPYFYYFFMGPVLLFVFDQLLSVSRRKIEITVIKAELLPSDVTYLEMKRPFNFEYKSGQWVRVACLAHGRNEYHPFTLTSAPHEENLTVHIRAVGPWTWGIRHLYDPRHLQDGKLPKVYIDGPYGEGHQDWHRFDVSILIGGGIGVTPFASILKDIAEKSRSGVRMTCKKVYFIWVTRTQRHFEWLTDILGQVEEKDTNDIVTIHVFITQFKERFDIRTTMLYICEKYFQKISERSLFTGLQSATHFGRPDFNQLFRMITHIHQDTTVFGVFSCGPPALTQSVERACVYENAYVKDVLLVHHYENI